MNQREKNVIKIIIGLLVLLILYFVILCSSPFLKSPLLRLGRIASVLVAGIAVIIGFYAAIMNYSKAIKNLNFKNWEWTKCGEPARRSYFFGPGYVQLGNTIKDTFMLMASSGLRIIKTGIEFGSELGSVFCVIGHFGGIIYLICGSICLYVVGMGLCTVIAIVHGAFTTVLMILTYIIFSVVLTIDKLYLLKNKIRSDCPICHNRFLVPMFMCQKCGAMHKKLVPGVYGIWKHRCSCSRKLPSTFMAGRSNLAAYCPNCEFPLVASDVRPIVFQLIGGSNAGKTVYLSAFFHEYLCKLLVCKKLKYTINKEYIPFFNKLENWYNGSDCPTTAQLNSQMYPILISSRRLGIKRQLSIYDIAGKMFDSNTADSQVLQQQIHYCDGFLFVIDPFSSGELRLNKIRAGENVSEFSDVADEKVAVNFINYFIHTGHEKANVRCNIPIAVLIVKSDVKEVKRNIGLAKIHSMFNHHPEHYGTYENARDSICRQFLYDIGHMATVENLETQFSTIHYFPVSAMGHSHDGTSYEPWGVMDAVEWIFPIVDKDLYSLMCS